MKSFNNFTDAERGLLRFKAMLQDKAEEEQSCTFNGNAKIVASGHPKFRYCAEFDGTGDYLDYGNTQSANFGTGDFSVEFWINTTSTTEQFVIMKGTTGTGGKSFMSKINRTANKVDFGIDDDVNSHTQEGSTTINDGVWHHVVGTYDRDGDLTVYVDCTDVGSEDISDSSTTINATTPFVIGTKSYDLGTGVLDGKISRIKLWNYALSATEVSQLYNGTIDNYRQNCKLLLDLPNLTDKSGNGNDGTNNGADIVASGRNSGNAFSFVAANTDYVDCGSDSSLRTQNVSVVVWAKEPSNAGYGGIVGNAGADGYDGYRTAKRDVHTFQGLIGDASSYDIINGATVIDDNNWHFLAFTVDASFLRLYVDGREDATAVARTKTTTWDDNFIIGNYGDLDAAAYWNGLIDQVSIYNVGLTKLQVNQIYHRTKRGLLQ